MNKTPLHNLHEQANAKIVDFAGWEMPLQYEGVIQEHQAVRNAAGIFDVSHMGEIMISGTDAEKFLQYLCCNDLGRIKDYKAQYSALLNEAGGVIDDLIIYKFNSNKFLLCVNASNTDEDLAWIKKQLSEYGSEEQNLNVEINNQTHNFGLIALQGPKSATILEDIIPDISKLKYFSFTETTYQETPLLIARTGYTGEDGFEIFIPWEDTAKIWTKLSQHKDISLCGLAARDTLRLEAGFPLHGHELSPEVPAPYSGLSWIIKFNKDFIGKSALSELNEKTKKSLVGFKVLSPGILREKTTILNADNQQIGEVTSGTKTPGLKEAIGMAIIESKYANPEGMIYAELRGRKLEAQVCKLPFYSKTKNNYN